MRTLLGCLSFATTARTPMVDSAQCTPGNQTNKHFSLLMILPSLQKYSESFTRENDIAVIKGFTVLMVENKTLEQNTLHKALRINSLTRSYRLRHPELPNDIHLWQSVQALFSTLELKIPPIGSHHNNVTYFVT